MSSFYRSLQAKKEIEALYHQKLDELPISYELLKIETTFGDTNIIITGSKENPPLVLLHGANSCAPVAIETMLELTKHFRVYGIDVLGQPNMSAEFRPNMNDDTYGKWMYEILSRFNIWNASLVGISFGGFISWKTLIFDEKRISKAFLIVPAGIVTSSPIKKLIRVFLPMKLYKHRKKIKYIHQYLGELFTEKDAFALEFLSNIFLRYKMDFSPIPLIKSGEAKRIKTPVYIFAAKDDLFFPGEKMLKRVQKIFPSLVEANLLENSKHVPNQKDNNFVIQKILSEK